MSDHNVGGWATWESAGFAFNGMIRAMGAPTGVASYPVIETEAIESSLTMIQNETAIATGYPDWNYKNLAKDGKEYPVINLNKSTKTSPVEIGANIYRDGEMIAFVPVPDTFYIDMNLESGSYDYCVTKVYEYTR